MEMVYSLPTTNAATLMSTPATSAPIQDPDLIRKVAQKDKNAFSSLYDRYGQLALNLAWRILSERQEAEDVVQEAFLQIWREAVSYNPKRGTVSTWITTITRSRAIDKLSSRGARRIYDPASEDFQEVAERLPDRICDDLIIVFWCGRQADLSVEQRVAIEMAYYEGMSVTEIADALREPLGTIKPAFGAGCRGLKEMLGHDQKPNAMSHEKTVRTLSSLAQPL
jgi:RNA polymerase sigma-70 factor (ECF subfamily)